MKTISIFVILGLLLMSIVSAAGTGFHARVDKTTSGDWMYLGGWNNGNYPTATMEVDFDSNTATDAYYTDQSTFGDPWVSKYTGHIGANEESYISTDIDVWTVNDPATTPATGGYTKYSHSQDTTSEYSNIAVQVWGYGSVAIDSDVHTESFAMHNTQTKINW